MDEKAIKKYRTLLKDGLTEILAGQLDMGYGIGCDNSVAELMEMLERKGKEISWSIRVNIKDAEWIEKGCSSE